MLIISNNRFEGIFLNYRRFGKLDWKVSALGFGVLRLPLTTPRTSRRDEGNVDEAEGIRMIRYAIDHGVNYVDSGNLYHEGKSEVVVGKALKDGYREKVRLSTKVAVGMIKSWKDQDRVFSEELNKLQTDYLDFYLLGGLGERKNNSWSRIKKLRLHDWAEKMMDEGKIHYLGFSARSIKRRRQLLCTHLLSLSFKIPRGFL